MWSTEKFGAVSGRRREAALRPRIFLNLTGHSVFDEPFILTDFGAGARPSYVHLHRKWGKLNRQTPIYRNRSKSQKTNNRDLLKSPKNQILQHHNLPTPGLILTPENQRFLPFLTGSASQTEIAVTYSKQRTAQFLTGSRIARKRSSNHSKFSPELVHGARVALHGWRLTVHGSRLLPGTAFRYNAPCPNFSREARNLT
jgi:hypothetical protein